MHAALRREPHFEKEPPFIHEALAMLEDVCDGGSHIWKTTRPPSVKLLRILEFRIISGEEVPGGTPGPPLRPTVGCRGEKLCKGKGLRSRDSSLAEVRPT
eukprot:1620248-Pyramimonas_sp.AAC.1